VSALRVARYVAPDRWLLLAVAILAPLGMLMVRGITMDEAPVGGLSAEAWRQIAYTGFGVVAMLALSRVHYHYLGRIALPLYAVSLTLLVLVLLMGADQFGARRWIDLGFTTVQPSEFAKLATVIAVATFAAHRDPGLRGVLVTLGLTAVPMALIVVEPDLGTTILLGGTWLVLMAMWGVSGRVLAGLTALALSLFPLAFAIGVSGYQLERLAVFVDPERDPLGSGFQLRQVEIALGSGGLAGRGFDGGPSALDGLATRGSDFAFAQLGEQAGLIGAGLLLLLYLLIAWRGFSLTSNAPDRFGRLLAGGLTALIVLQAAMHIAVNLRLFPATGIALPFVSQGGSALLAMFAAAGILQSIAAHRSSAAQYARERWE
jgi:rod shape determining protein RodA